jgi:hypothetical protein
LIASALVTLVVVAEVPEKTEVCYVLIRKSSVCFGGISKIRMGTDVVTYVRNYENSLFTAVLAAVHVPMESVTARCVE